MRKKKTTMVKVVKERWRYAVLLAKLSNHILQQGVMKAFGVLIPSMVYQFNTSYATIGFLVSLQITMNYMACPLAQLLIRKYDVRHVAMLGGLGTGLAVIGSSFTRTPLLLGAMLFIAGVFSSPLCQVSFVVMRQHFGDKFGYANSVSYLGSLIGGMTIPFLAAEFFSWYGLSGALLCLGGLFLNGVPIGATFRPPRPLRHNKEPFLQAKEDVPYSSEVESNNKTHMHKDVGTTKSVCRKLLDIFVMAFDYQALKNERFYTTFFLPCQIFLDIVFIGWALFVVSYGIDVGIEESLAVYLPISGAVGGFVSRSTLAVMMHRKPKWSPYCYALSVVVSAVALFIYPVHSSLTHLLVVSFFTGFGLYGAASTYYAVIAATVSQDNFPGIIAISFFISGIGAVTAGALTGYLFDVIGSFETVFRVLGGMMVAIIVLVIVYMYNLKCTRRRKRDHTYGD